MTGLDDLARWLRDAADRLDQLGRSSQGQATTDAIREALFGRRGQPRQSRGLPADPDLLAGQVEEAFFRDLPR